MATTKYRSMRGYFLGFAVGGLALTSSFLAAPTVDAAAGKEKAEICAGCHGDNGTQRSHSCIAAARRFPHSAKWRS
jgi:cytochrome c553